MLIVTSLPQSFVAEGGVSLHPLADHLNSEFFLNPQQTADIMQSLHLYQLQVYRSRFFTRPKVNSLPEPFDLVFKIGGVDIQFNKRWFCKNAKFIL